MPRTSAMQRATASLLLAASLVAAGTSGAVAVGGGEWWFEGMGVAEVHGQGARGAGVSVAVIDTRINPGVPVFEGVDLRVREPSFCVDEQGGPVPAVTTDVADGRHGTNVAGLVARVAPDATILYYAIDDGTAEGADTHCDPAPVSADELALVPDAVAQALRAAVDDGADVISVSLAEDLISSDMAESLAWAMSRGVVVVFGLGEYQGSERAPDGFALTNGVVAVEALDADLVPLEGEPGSGEPMEHDKVTVVAPGVDLGTFGDPASGDWSAPRLESGTSFAAPITAGAIAAVWSVYPDATGNQMIQSLIHNTDVDDHELFYNDVYGYGVLGLQHMLRTDPLQYEDVNPLLLGPGDGWVPRAVDVSPEQVAAATRPVFEGEDGWVDPYAPTSSPSPSDVTAAPAPPEQGAPGVPLWVGAAAVAAGALAVTALTVLSVVLSTRRRGAVPGPGVSGGGGPGVV